MNAPQHAPAAATTVTAFDLDAALEEATRAMHRVSAKGKDSRDMTESERRAMLESLCRALGLNPLVHPVRFLVLNGAEMLYVTRQGTDQIAARLRINRETIVGPEVRDIGGQKLVFCQVRAREPGPDGRSDVATATLPLKDPSNDLMKCETKAKRRAVLSLVGLGLLTEEDAEAAQASDAAPKGTPADLTEAWLSDLAKVGRVRDLRGVYSAHSRGLSTTGRDGRHDVRGWLRARGLNAVDVEATALIATVPEAVADALELAALEPGDDPAPKPDTDALVKSMRALLTVVADEHSILQAKRILARSYAEAEKMTSNVEALKALVALASKPDTDPTPPTGTDGPAREPGSDDGDDGSAAAYEAHRAAQGEARAQVTELRVVRDESSDPCVTSAAAWAAHLATLHSKWHVCGSFRKRASAFSAEGVHAAREAATLDRLRALGEAAPRTLLYAPPPAPKKRAA